ncbi:MAG: protein-S-isoprenylcysteine O-methyltransferase Ste14 [Halioglobus sp.]|jgi:protein-S-isoprenylcysteine O-methyltransferase Ste14
MDNNKQGKATRPQSVTNLYINFTALLVTILSFWMLITFGASIGTLPAVFILALSYAVPIMALEAIWIRPLGGKQVVMTIPSASHYRVLVKLLGLALTAALVALVYWALPEYRGSFYDRYYAAVADIAPYFLALCVPYLYWMDRRGGGQRDGYWHMGQLVLGHWNDVDRKIIGQHLLGWIVKLFFLPLMLTYLIDKVTFYRAYDYTGLFVDFESFYDFAFQSLFFIDLLIAAVGYMTTYKATDSHIRSTEPTLLGWMVALMCYQPFWSFFSAQYIDYANGTKSWGAWMFDSPPLYNTWGIIILILTFIYVWATLSFGIRFSNLTNRGIITNGPYAFSKHPAYLSKNLSWWLISMPFMLNSGVDDSIRLSLLLLLLNFVYFMRARTEERHLSQDPAYRAYAAYIEEHGLFRRVGNSLPILKFRPGQLFNLKSQA